MKEESQNQLRASDQELLRFLEFPGKRRPTSGGESTPVEGGSEGCPGAASYLRLVKGESSPEESALLLDHASGCYDCGGLLGRCIHILDGNPSDEEAAAIATLAARRQWQQEMAATLAARPVQGRRNGSFKLLLGQGKPHGRGAGWLSHLPRSPARSWMAGGAVAAGLAAGVLLMWQGHANSVEHQLAMAYSESRTLELRIPEAGFAQTTAARHTRGAEVDHESSLLLDARAHLARELKQSPEDEHWLELRARADLLEERYDAAIDVLDRLIAAGPPNVLTLTDAATAYYQRGLISGRELDRSTALDDLKRADELAPADPVVLFNEAILMEDRGQMINAVEVWNRYMAVERDPQWAAEGKRKLAALEQTLNRFKSQGRVDKMLATPEAMDALAADREKLKQLDEELATYELDKLLPAAYPVASHLVAYAGAQPVERLRSEQVRGSPCVRPCVAARQLLRAIGLSLELQHQDYWISDLLPSAVDSLPGESSATYAKALQLMSKAIREDTTGSPSKAAKLAEQSQELFKQLNGTVAAIKDNPELSRAMQVGEERAGLEHLFSLQRLVDFKDAREYAPQLQAGPLFRQQGERYPWMTAARLVTMKVVDDTPETREAGAKMLSQASTLASDHRYVLLISRIAMRQAGGAEAEGDMEAATHWTMSTFHQLWEVDAPAIRIAATIDELPYLEEHSLRLRAREVYLREAMDWFELLDSRNDAAAVRMELARCELTSGNRNGAEADLANAQREGAASKDGKRGAANFSESAILFADSYLENGDLSKASQYLDQAATYMGSYSDSWGLRTYSASRAQLDLEKGKLEVAAQTLEEEIRNIEGGRISVSSNAVAGDASTASKLGQQDHDLYAELAATWLAEGRSPESILALWGRFLSRSHGHPVSRCGEALNCDLPRLLAAQRKLGNSLVAGQIVLLDRVLTYTMDKSTVRWGQKLFRRQQVLDSVERLELAASSPLTSAAQVKDIGGTLSYALLPALPARLNSGGLLLLAPDPILQNLSWPVLPASSGALGFQYPIAELRSIFDETGDGRDMGRNGRGEFKLDKSSLDKSRFGEAGLGKPLIIGSSTAGNGEAPLPEALTEALAVGQILKPAELLVGEQATAARVSQLMSAATIFHFAGHAVETRNGTELLLAPDGPHDKGAWVDGAFLRKHPPQVCRLAVLSGCSTGVRAGSWDDPLANMVETFGSLGVPEVVATRWAVDSEASVPFMEEFYRGLREGETVSMALMAARLIQSQQSRYSNPYYWGAYYVTGREKIHSVGELHARR